MVYKQKPWSGWSPIKQKNIQEYTKELEKESAAYKGQMPASRKGVQKNPDGSYSTHLMAWGGGDGHFYAFPTLFQDDEGVWEQGGRESLDKAREKGEAHEFDTKEEAEAFAAGSWKEKHFNRGK